MYKNQLIITLILTNLMMQSAYSMGARSTRAAQSGIKMACESFNPENLSSSMRQAGERELRKVKSGANVFEKATNRVNKNTTVQFPRVETNYLLTPKNTPDINVVENGLIKIGENTALKSTVPSQLALRPANTSLMTIEQPVFSDYTMTAIAALSAIAGAMISSQLSGDRQTARELEKQIMEIKQAAQAAIEEADVLVSQYEANQAAIEEADALVSQYEAAQLEQELAPKKSMLQKLFA